MEPVTFYQNPRIDFLFGTFGGEPIPTKQDKFKPVEVYGVDEDGNHQPLDDFYVKKPGKDSILRFQEYIKGLAKDVISEDKIIKKPNEVEVILSISITQSRFKEVDIDNLAKFVLDCLNGVAFEDDSQVSSLLCNKHVHPMKENGIFIAITKLSGSNRGFFQDIKLFGELNK